MTPPTKHEREKAMQILNKISGFGDRVKYDIIVQALADHAQETRESALAESSRPPKDHIRLEDGRDVKLLGVLPITADGCAYGHHSRYDKPLYGITDKGKVVEAAVRAIPVGDSSFRPEDCYSTKEAALSAHQANTGSTKHEG